MSKLKRTTAPRELPAPADMTAAQCRAEVKGAGFVVGEFGTDTGDGRTWRVVATGVATITASAPTRAEAWRKVVEMAREVDEK